MELLRTEVGIQKRNTYELVADRLLSELRSQGAEPGFLLPTERELTERFKVGRSSVREALRMLESQGVIVSLKHGQFELGSMAAIMRRPIEMMISLEASDLTQVFELRQMLEPSLAGFAALRGDADEMDTMQAAIDDMAAALPVREAMLEADLRFHRAIASASGNSLGREIVDALHSSLRGALGRAYYVSEDALEQHRQILTAIRTRSPSAAHQAMAVHMEWIGGILEQELASAEGDESPLASR